MKGSAQLADINNEVLTLNPGTSSPMNQSLRTSVKESLQGYFTQLDGQTPANLYSMVMAEVEKPLIEMVLKLTNGNQSKAAIILGLSRGTLRKKMAMYAIH